MKVMCIKKLGYLIKNTQDEFWNRRWTESYEALILDQNSSHVDKREMVYQLSIDGIIESPIFGNGYKFGNVFNKDESYGVGNHSTVIDTLAQFGIVGGIPLLLFLLYPLINARRKQEDFTYLVPFYVMSCLNPTLRCYHVMVIIYLIIPCAQYLLNKDNYSQCGDKFPKFQRRNQMRFVPHL